ncbi:MAG: hypothetical protein ACE5E4_04420 [Candidatus Binatia bacterium]
MLEYVARHDPDEVTKAMNRICDVVDPRRDRVVSSAASRVLEYTEW